MFYDLRMALRQFRHHPAFALLTVIVLGLGIGAAAAVYTIVDGVVLKPLPFTAPDRLVAIWDTNYEQGLEQERLSPVNFMDVRALTGTYQDAAAWWRPDVNLTDDDLEPVRIKTIEVSANLFQLLGVSPQVGPGFPKDGPFYDRPLICVISDRLWRTRYNADPGLIGKQIKLNDTPYTVAGVMPPRFSFPGDVDIWERLQWDLTQHSRGAHFMEAIARLAPGVDLAQANRDTNALAARLATEFPATQSRVEPAPDSAARKPARLLPAGALRAARRGVALDAHRRVQRRRPAAHALARSSSRARGARRARRLTAPPRAGARRGKRGAVGRGRPRRRRARVEPRAPPDRDDARGDSTAGGRLAQLARRRADPRDHHGHDGGLRPRAVAAHAPQAEQPRRCAMATARRRRADGSRIGRWSSRKSRSRARWSRRRRCSSRASRRSSRFRAASRRRACSRPTCS